MNVLIAEKCERGADGAPSFGAARRWAVEDLIDELWKRVGDHYGMLPESVQQVWASRRSRRLRTASYVAGSFVVVSGADETEGTKRDPHAAERWWSDAAKGERVQFLTAWVVESSGEFDVIRKTRGLCETCSGSGEFRGSVEGAAPADTACETCAGLGKTRKVTYR